METLQALSARAHMKLLEMRMCCFRDELQASLDEAQQIKRSFDIYGKKEEELKKECSAQREEIERNYNEQILEYKKQIKISEDMILKEKEKKQSLLDYFIDLDIPVGLPDDVKDFDWCSLEKMASNSDVTDHIEEQKSKALLLEEINTKANTKLNELLQLLNSTIMTKNKVKSKLEELKKMAQEWKQVIVTQEKKITKMREDNTRLNILVKQCVNVNEPMSRHITENVKAKCQSFMNSNTIDELVNGLAKYKSRQDRIIKLLKHKVNKLTRDINQLQVAKDTTVDQMEYYKMISRTDY